MRQSDIFGAGSVLDSLRLNAHDVVLDLGCGDARWLVAAAARGCAGRGVDLNEDLLQKGHEAAAEAGVRKICLGKVDERRRALRMLNPLHDRNEVAHRGGEGTTPATTAFLETDKQK